MTPLLGTKISSALVGANSGGERRAARSLLSCALWRGMGRLWRGMGGMVRPEPLSAHRPHRQQRLSGFHETRDTNHGFFSVGARGVASQETAVRTTAPAGKSLFSSSPLFTIVHHCSPLFTKNIVLRQCPRAARSLLSCALWRGMGGYGAAWAAYCPRASVLVQSAVLGGLVASAVRRNSRRLRAHAVLPGRRPVSGPASAQGACRRLPAVCARPRDGANPGVSHRRPAPSCSQTPPMEQDGPSNSVAVGGRDSSQC